MINQQNQYAFDNLELLAKQVVEGFIIGLHKSPFHGFSVEFAEHRIYNEGESIKNIDWKVYARTEKLFVKRFEEETNLRCQIVIDTSSSMHYPDDAAFLKQNKYNKIRFSVVAAAALIHLLKKQRDAFGLSLFNETLEYQSQCKSSTVHQKLLLTELERQLNTPTLNKKTSSVKALHEIAEAVHKRSLVLLFSDMLDSSESSDELFQAMQHLKYNKHEVILFHVIDKKMELDFEFENRPYLFVDIETGEKLKLQGNQIKDEYQRRANAFKNELKMRCTQFNIDFIEADVNEDFRQILLPFFSKRSKMI